MNNLLSFIMTKACITLPVMEITLLVLTLSLCLVFRLSKVGLIIAYIFAYRWGWMFFMGQEQHFLVAYSITGIAVGTLTVIGMLRSHHTEE